MVSPEYYSFLTDEDKGFLFLLLKTVVDLLDKG
jgi:hypothetical protein